jgi:PiT family inorganic phosphate transporter
MRTQSAGGEMATVAAPPAASAVHEKFAKGPGLVGTLIFTLVAIGALGYIGWNMVRDLSQLRAGSALPYILLGVALLVALAFEFVNGFHDTANAVATVIYTHSLDPHIAVVWSGFWNFLGVVTVGEKIGKNHLTYAQGAAAEITAMATIGAADAFGLPVSTTHVLSSGVAGTMAANRSGLQWATVRNLLMAWVLTLPAAMVLSGFLFWSFRKIF